MKYERQTYKDLDIGEALEAGFDVTQLKYDGIWAAVHVEPTCMDKNLAKYYSREGQYKGQKLTSLPPGVYLGEYMYQSQWAQTPELRDKCFLFDIVDLEGEDLRELTYRERYRQLKIVAKDLHWFPIVENFPIAAAFDLWERNVATRKFEGLVFRRASDTYYADLARHKIDITGDYFICRFYPGTGKYSDSLGAIGVSSERFGPELMRVGGGFSDALRRELWNNQAKYLGRCVEVVGKARFDSGALRHPNFSHFRTDKDHY
jgi:hypothetical protein